MQLQRSVNRPGVQSRQPRLKVRRDGHAWQASGQSVAQAIQRVTRRMVQHIGHPLGTGSGLAEKHSFGTFLTNLHHLDSGGCIEHHLERQACEDPQER